MASWNEVKDRYALDLGAHIAYVVKTKTDSDLATRFLCEEDKKLSSEYREHQLACTLFLETLSIHFQAR